MNKSSNFVIIALFSLAICVVQGKIKSDDAFDTDMGIHRERLDQVANLAQDMVQQGFSKVSIFMSLLLS